MLKVHTGIAVGKIAAPALARSQATGSVIQGIGYALYEAREVDARTGDILTGMIAGLIAQHPNDIVTAVRAAVWLHGRCGELGAEHWTEFSLLASELLNYLPRAIRECL